LKVKLDVKKKKKDKMRGMIVCITVSEHKRTERWV